MKPVQQTILHDPANGKTGNCIVACVASLLDMDIEEVPHFLEVGGAQQWRKHLSDWLLPRGLAYVEIWCAQKETYDWYLLEYLRDIGYYTLSGPSPRHQGVEHMVIARGDEIVHDPHPSNAGLADGYRWIGFIVARCGA